MEDGLVIGPWVALVLSVLVVAVAGALRAAGASLVRTPRADALHDAAEGDARAAVIADLLEDRPRLQPAIGMVHSALLVTAAIPATWALTELTTGASLLAALVAEWVAIVGFGDVLPRTFGRERAGRLAYRWAGLLTYAVRLGSKAADLVMEDEDESALVPESPEEVQEEEERRLISSVLEFSDTLVREVMVPRTDMVTVDADATIDEVLDVVVKEGYSRIPVVDHDEVVGIVYAKDLLRHLAQGGGTVPVTAIMRPPYFVPETKRVSELLRDMQANKTHIAVVVDEFGGVAGVVTIEDLLEELVGEIVDEYDVEEPLVIPQPDGSLIVDARLPVEDLAELLRVDLPDGEWETVGGLVLELAGRVPREGEVFDHQGIRFEVLDVQGRRVSRVRVTMPEFADRTEADRT